MIVKSEREEFLGSTTGITSLLLSRPLEQEEMGNFLDYASNVLKEQEVSGAVKCIKCGAEGYHDMEIINDIPLFMCEDCKIKKPRI